MSPESKVQNSKLPAGPRAEDAPSTHIQSQRDWVLQPRVASLRATLGGRCHRPPTLKGLWQDLSHPDSVGRRNPFRVDSRFHASTLQRSNALRAFTLVEILMAIGIFGLVMAAIYSTWTAIIRATTVGRDVAAAVQRSRIAARTIEDSLLCIESFAANQKYYGFAAENGSEAYLSFVARLPKSFPRSGKFGDLDVRRLTFSIESGSESGRELVLRQCPLLGDFDTDEKEHPLVLAKFVSEFKVEFWDSRQGDWTDEWKETKTNSLPPLVKISLALAQNAYTMNQRAQQEVVRIVNIPSVAVQPAWQGAGGPGFPGAPPPPGAPGQLPLPGQPYPAPGGLPQFQLPPR